MLKSKLKEITRWGITVRGCSVFFRTKEAAVKAGIMSIKVDPNTKMFEEYRLWDVTQRPAKIIDEKQFDRTILITEK